MTPPTLAILGIEVRQAKPGQAFHSDPTQTVRASITHREGKAYARLWTTDWGASWSFDGPYASTPEEAAAALEELVREWGRR